MRTPEPLRYCCAPSACTIHPHLVLRPARLVLLGAVGDGAFLKANECLDQGHPEQLTRDRRVAQHLQGLLHCRGQHGNTHRVRLLLGDLHRENRFGEGDSAAHDFDPMQHL